MIVNKRSHIFFTAVFFVSVIAMYVNSTAWFRIKLANHCRSRSEYDAALRLYNKILRKNSVKNRLPSRTFAEISFKSGNLYSRLNMPNAAIEYYAKAGSRFARVDLSRYFEGSSSDRDKLLAIGLLEGGQYAKAAAEFRRIKDLYPDFQYADKYEDIAKYMEKQGMVPSGEKFYFAVGDSYIKKQLFDDAREFYTKRILRYGINPMRVLSYLKKMYSRDTYIREKTWGGDIYVTLEDFESSEPRLGRSGATETDVKSHYITAEDSYRGKHSEFLDIKYHPGQGPDSWEKIVSIPLGDKDLSLGLRLFAKSTDPSVNMSLGIEATYPKQGTTGIAMSSAKRDIGGAWQELSIEYSLSAMAEGMAKSSTVGWDTKGMFINKALFTIWPPSDMNHSYKFYISALELYILN